LAVETKPAERSPEEMDGLLARCRERDPRSLDALARWCLPRVRRTVLLARGGDDADDLVQVAMSRVFEKLGMYRGDASFFVWVDRIAINAVRDNQRRRRLVLLDDPGALASLDEVVRHSAADGPEMALERGRLFTRLARHFAAIRVERRLPLVLSILHGYSVPEVAAILDVSLDTAKMRLRRGRADLLARLKADPPCAEALKELGRCAD
jgi:RNA polymerase sigma-70 factor, ECF subfamily